MGEPVTIENYFDAIKKGASWPLLTEFPAQEAGGLLNALKVYQKGLGEEIGSMSWDPVGGVISTLNVAKRFRRQGIATKLWDTASKLGPVAHSVVRSVAGDDWAKAVGGHLPELKHLVPAHAQGGYLGGLRKFHDWNGVIPGNYGQEVGAILQAGKESVYDTDYINSLRNGTMNTTSTNNKNINIGSVQMTFTEPVKNGRQVFDEFKALISFENNASSSRINLGVGA